MCLKTSCSFHTLKVCYVYFSVLDTSLLEHLHTAYIFYFYTQEFFLWLLLTRVDHVLMCVWKWQMQIHIFNFSLNKNSLARGAIATLHLSEHALLDYMIQCVFIGFFHTVSSHPHKTKDMICDDASHIPTYAFLQPNVKSQAACFHQVGVQGWKTSANSSSHIHCKRKLYHLCIYMYSLLPSPCRTKLSNTQMFIIKENRIYVSVN